MSMNWNDILAKQAEGGANIPVEGKYPVIVIESEAVKAGSGNWMIKLRLRVTAGPYVDKDAWTNIVFATDNEVAMKFTLRKLKALGVSREYLRTHNPSPQQIAEMVKGAEVEAEITVGTYDDEPTNDVKNLRPLKQDGLGGVSAPVPSPPAPDPSAPPRPPLTEDEVPAPPVPAAETPAPPVPQPEASPEAPPAGYKPEEEPF